jgi:hypothetical protein
LQQRHSTSSPPQQHQEQQQQQQQRSLVHPGDEQHNFLLPGKWSGALKQIRSASSPKAQSSIASPVGEHTIVGWSPFGQSSFGLLRDAGATGKDARGEGAEEHAFSSLSSFSSFSFSKSPPPDCVNRAGNRGMEEARGELLLPQASTTFRSPLFPTPLHAFAPALNTGHDISLTAFPTVASPSQPVQDNTDSPEW